MDPLDDAAADRPLDGLLVLDFSQFLAGPSCALRLADLGAEVIKIERPQGGDLCRSLRIADQTFADDSALFHTINRNKKSFAADLKSGPDLDRVKSLVAQADVMIHNFRPGVMERLGLGFDQVSAMNPAIVYAGVSGYGDAGPWRDKPGQDLLVQSLSGLAWLSGDAGDPPTPMGLSVADMAAGAHLVQGVLALLLRRGRTGKGGRVDVSLMESAIDLQFESFTAFLNGDGAQPVRSATANANAYLAAPYGIYATADGYLAIAMTPVARLQELLSCDTLATFADPAVAYAQRDAIKAILADHLAGQTADHWLSILEPAGVWSAKVQTWPELTAHAGFKALDLVQQVQVYDARLSTTRCPIRVDGAVLTSDRAAPGLGADTDMIASEYGLPGGASR